MAQPQSLDDQQDQMNYQHELDSSVQTLHQIYNLCSSVVKPNLSPHEYKANSEKGSSLLLQSLSALSHTIESMVLDFSSSVSSKQDQMDELASEIKLIKDHLTLKQLNDPPPPKPSISLLLASNGGIGKKVFASPYYKAPVKPKVNLDIFKLDHIGVPLSSHYTFVSTATFQPSQSQQKNISLNNSNQKMPNASPSGTLSRGFNDSFNASSLGRSSIGRQSSKSRPMSTVFTAMPSIPTSPASITSSSSIPPLTTPTSTLPSSGTEPAMFLAGPITTSPNAPLMHDALPPASNSSGNFLPPPILPGTQPTIASSQSAPPNIPPPQQPSSFTQMTPSISASKTSRSGSGQGITVPPPPSSIPNLPIGPPPNMIPPSIPFPPMFMPGPPSPVSNSPATSKNSIPVLQKEQNLPPNLPSARPPLMAAAFPPTKYDSQIHPDAIVEKEETGPPAPPLAVDSTSTETKSAVPPPQKTPADTEDQINQLFQDLVPHLPTPAPAEPPKETSQPLTSPPKNCVKVLYAYSARAEDELSISPGDILQIFEQDVGDGWIGCVNQAGEKGLLPSSYVVPI